MRTVGTHFAVLGELTEEQRRAATPDPTRLVSLGVVTKFRETLTDHGMKLVPETFEVLCELQGAYGMGTRTWRRYKSDPNTLVPQFSVEKTDRVEPVEEWTKEELEAMRSRLPQRTLPPPDPPPQPLFEPPDF